MKILKCSVRNSFYEQGNYLCFVAAQDTYTTSFRFIQARGYNTAYAMGAMQTFMSERFL
jgi:hypothetical protein